MPKSLLPVDRNLEIPPLGQGHPKYPWSRLEPVRGNPPRGDSFLVPCDDDEVERTFNTLTRSAHNNSKKTGKKFTMRRVKEGIRVWRLL